jgi:hypothetical protein
LYLKIALKNKLSTIAKAGSFEYLRIGGEELNRQGRV